jgi:serine/threonine protein phosphatase PrpC
MHYMATADTDIGIKKQTNQDSILIKHGQYEKGEILLAVICDGMGGLKKGEVASATVVKKFSEWFDSELPFELKNLDMNIIADKWSLLLKDLNLKIAEYGQQDGIRLGTTFTGVLFIDDQYLAVHVGDTRLYQLDSGLKQLTTDHTFVAREIRRGNLTVEQAKKDKRRNMLLQCVGASERIEPEILIGTVQQGAYMLCSDGFRHEISESEIYESLNPVNLINKEAMHNNVKYLIEQVKKRNEKDNISVVLVKVN